MKDVFVASSCTITSGVPSIASSVDNLPPVTDTKALAPEIELSLELFVNLTPSPMLYPEPDASI